MDDFSGGVAGLAPVFYGIFGLVQFVQDLCFGDGFLLVLLLMICSVRCVVWRVPCQFRLAGALLRLTAVLLGFVGFPPRFAELSLRVA